MKKLKGIMRNFRQSTTTFSNLELGDLALLFAKLATTSSLGLEIPHLGDSP
jgi:hypothetical protein